MTAKKRKFRPRFYISTRERKTGDCKRKEILKKWRNGSGAQRDSRRERRAISEYDDKGKFLCVWKTRTDQGSHTVFWLWTRRLSLLFYDSAIPALFFLPALCIYEKEKKKESVRRQKEKAEQQFLEGMRAVSNALLAGYSMENAVAEEVERAEKDIR